MFNRQVATCFLVPTPCGKSAMQSGPHRVMGITVLGAPTSAHDAGAHA